MEDKPYTSFKEFYPFYLTQHSNETNRRLHIVGTTLALMLLMNTLLFFSYIKLVGVFLIGYGFSWFGHFFFEKNKPAAFKQPIYSFMGDMRMLKETITGKRKFWFV